MEEKELIEQRKERLWKQRQVIDKKVEGILKRVKELEKLKGSEKVLDYPLSKKLFKTPEETLRGMGKQLHFNKL